MNLFEIIELPLDFLTFISPKCGNCNSGVRYYCVDCTPYGYCSFCIKLYKPAYCSKCRRAFCYYCSIEGKYICRSCIIALRK